MDSEVTAQAAGLDEEERMEIDQDGINQNEEVNKQIDEGSYCEKWSELELVEKIQRLQMNEA